MWIIKMQKIKKKIKDTHQFTIYRKANIIIVLFQFFIYIHTHAHASNQAHIYKCKFIPAHIQTSFVSYWSLGIYSFMASHLVYCDHF